MLASGTLDEFSALGCIGEAQFGGCKDRATPDDGHGWENVRRTGRGMALLFTMKLRDQFGKCLFHVLTDGVTHIHKDTIFTGAQSYNT